MKALYLFFLTLKDIYIIITFTQRPAIDGGNPGKQSRQTNISLQSHLPTHGRRFENTEQESKTYTN